MARPRQEMDSASLIAADQVAALGSAMGAVQPMLEDARKKKAKKTRAQGFGGSAHGKSIKNPATYEALKREGHSKSSAAAISNAALNKGYAYGVHGRSKRRR
jgi:hypothetical protein